MEARWQGLSKTLIIPQRKQPRAARARPALIHSLTRRKRESITCPSPGRAGNPPFCPLGRKSLLFHEAAVGVAPLAAWVKKFLGGDRPTLDSLALLGIFPDFKKNVPPLPSIPPR